MHIGKTCFLLDMLSNVGLYEDKCLLAMVDDNLLHFQIGLASYMYNKSAEQYCKVFLIEGLSYICGSSMTYNRRPGFELMTSRSWQHISCHWDACSNHSAISELPEK